MFFTVSLNNAGWNFESDPGWTQYGTIWAKGYAMDQTLEDVVATYNFNLPPNTRGNFCLVEITNRGVRIGHSKDRSFPLWADTGYISNLQPKGEQIWANDLLELDALGIVNKTKITIPGFIDLSMTMDQVCDLILERVINDAKKFLDHNHLPIRTFRSGGLDTTFLHTLTQYLAIPCNEFTNKVIEPNLWLEKHKLDLEKYWGYRQIHHWNQSCFILTGSHGDEYFLRGPTAISMIMSWHGVNFTDKLYCSPDSYHHWYFNKPSNVKLFEETWNNRQQLCEQYYNWTDLADQIINVLANDHQHWHLGQTLSWTPQKDLDIARWALCLSLEDLIDNSLNGTLIKRCIQRLDPTALKQVSAYKNKPIL